MKVILLLILAMALCTSALVARLPSGSALFTAMS